jgi:hypothetical protein
VTTSTSVFVAEPGSIAAAGAGLCSIGRTSTRVRAGQTKVIEIKYLKKTRLFPSLELASHPSNIIIIWANHICTDPGTQLEERLRVRTWC